MGQRETDGPNDSRRIREYQDTTNAKPGSPYCASAVSTWVKEAAQELGVDHTFKFSASAQALYFKNRQLTVQPQDLTADDLPVVYVEAHEGGKGHTGIVIGFDPATGRFQEIAANTTDKGSREGGVKQGVHALDIRSIHDAKLLGFVRIA